MLIVADSELDDTADDKDDLLSDLSYPLDPPLRTNYPLVSDRPTTYLCCRMKFVDDDADDDFLQKTHFILYLWPQRRRAPNPRQQRSRLHHHILRLALPVIQTVLSLELASIGRSFWR